jgi:hypothetical protein
MEKGIRIIRPARGAVPATRRFVISESYSGERKLSELLTELLCEEYRRSKKKAKEKTEK